MNPGSAILAWRVTSNFTSRYNKYIFSTIFIQVLPAASPMFPDLLATLVVVHLYSFDNLAESSPVS